MNIAIVLSGGTGTRLGADVPKQYIKVGSDDIITACLRTLYENEAISFVQIVAAEEWHGEILQEQEKIPQAREKFRGFSNPGENRQLSILNALLDVKNYAKDEDVVLVHDAARPMLSHGLIERLLHAAGEHDGAMPVLPMKDTVYYSEDGKSVSKLLKRECIFAGQAPEAYRFGKYLAANQALAPQQMVQVKGSTEPAVLGGMDIALVDGEEKNFKITTPEDLERYKRYESTDFV